MDITTLENWLWEAACSIRGPLDAPRYKDYILPLLFYKRLSDVYKVGATRRSPLRGGVSGWLQGRLQVALTGWGVGMAAGTAAGRPYGVECRDGCRDGCRSPLWGRPG